MNNKRQLQLSPSEKSYSNKKHISANMPSEDKFSWKVLSDMFDDKLDTKLDEKLADVARKEDINALKEEINALNMELTELKAENAKIRREMSQMSERIDRKIRQINVVINGLTVRTSVPKIMC